MRKKNRNWGGGAKREGKRSKWKKGRENMDNRENWEEKGVKENLLGKPI